MYESRAALSDPLFFLSQPCGEEIEFSLQRHFAILRCDSRSTARLPSEAVGGVWSMCEVSMINVFGRLAAGWDGGVCVVLSRWWEVGCGCWRAGMVDEQNLQVHSKEIFHRAHDMQKAGSLMMSRPTISPPRFWPQSAD